MLSFSGANICPWSLVPFFQISWRTVNSKPPTIPFGIVACTSSDNLSWNSCIDHNRVTTQHWIVCRPSKGYHQALNCIQTITGLPPNTELYIQIITGLPPSIELYTDHHRVTTHPIVYNWMRVRHCESWLTTLKVKNMFIKTSQLTISSPMH